LKDFFTQTIQPQNTNALQGHKKLFK